MLLSLRQLIRERAAQREGYATPLPMRIVVVKGFPMVAVKNR